MPGHTYSLKVHAVNAIGEGEWSSVSTFLMTEPPSPPINVMLLSYEDSFVFFEWGQPVWTGGQAILGFRIYRRDTSLAEDNEPVMIA